jgi:hypothetical protein
MAYSENPIEGALAVEEDPSELLLALLRNDNQHPYVRQVLERRNADIREHQRYELMTLEARRIEGKKAKLAEKRAAKILDRHLTHKQRRELARKKYFHVRGQDGRTYQVTAHSQQNVFLIENGRRTMQFCAVSSVHIPIPDLLLAQKLLIEHNIEHFLAIANKWETRLEDGRVVRDRVLDTLLDRMDRATELHRRLDEARVRVVPLPGIEIREVPTPVPEFEVAV